MRFDGEVGVSFDEPSNTALCLDDVIGAGFSEVRGHAPSADTFFDRDCRFHLVIPWPFRKEKGGGGPRCPLLAFPIPIGVTSEVDGNDLSGTRKVFNAPAWIREIFKDYGRFSNKRRIRIEPHPNRIRIEPHRSDRRGIEMMNNVIHEAPI